MLKQKILENIGLTNSETKIYLVLLEQGSSSAGMISRNTGIHRRSVYDAIERLVQKGLVSYIKTNNRKYFEAVDPERLVEIVNQQKEDVQSIMIDLKKLQERSKEKKETLFFRGKAALKSAFEDQIEKDIQEVLVLGATTKANNILPYYFSHFENIKKKNKIKSRMIFNESERKEEYVKNIVIGQKRFVPDEIKSDMAVNVYGNNSMIVVWKDEPISILIREKAIADGFRNYFEFIWKVAKK